MNRLFRRGLILALAALAAPAAAQMQGARGVPPGAGPMPQVIVMAPAWLGALSNFFDDARGTSIRLEGSLRTVSRVDIEDKTRQETFGPLALALERLGHTPESFLRLDASLAHGEAKHAMAMAEEMVRADAKSRIDSVKEFLAGPEGGDASKGVPQVLALMRARSIYGPYMDKALRDELEGVRAEASERYAGHRLGKALEFFARNADLLRRSVPEAAVVVDAPGEERRLEIPTKDDLAAALMRPMARMDGVEPVIMKMPQDPAAKIQEEMERLARDPEYRERVKEAARAQGLDPSIIDRLVSQAASEPGEDLPGPEEEFEPHPEPTLEHKTLERAQEWMSEVHARLAAAPKASDQDVARAAKMVEDLERAERDVEARLADLYGDIEEAKAARAKRPSPREQALKEWELAENKELRTALGWAKKLSYAQLRTLAALSAADEAGLLKDATAAEAPPSGAWGRFVSGWNSFWGAQRRRLARAPAVLEHLIVTSKRLDEAIRDLEEEASPDRRRALAEALPAEGAADSMARAAQLTITFLREDALLEGLKSLSAAVAKALETARAAIAPRSP